MFENRDRGVAAPQAALREAASNLFGDGFWGRDKLAPAAEPVKVAARRP